MNLADIFLQALEQDKGASDIVRKMGKKLAEQHKSALETTAEFARRQCEMWHQQDAAAQIVAKQKHD